MRFFLPFFALLLFLTTGCSNSLAYVKYQNLEDPVITIYTKEEQKAVKEEIDGELKKVSEDIRVAFSEAIRDFSAILADVSDLNSYYHEYKLDAGKLLDALGTLRKNLETCIDLLEAMQGVHNGDKKPTVFYYEEKES